MKNSILLEIPNAKTKSILLSTCATISNLKHYIQQHLNIPIHHQLLSCHLKNFTDDTKIFTPNDNSLITFRLLFRLPGGKGGFGSMLKAQGGKMSRLRAGEEVNVTSCRDLSGRRLKTIQDAERLAKYLSSEKDREKAKQDAIDKKIEKGLKEIDPPKVRFDDTQFLQDHEKSLNEISATVSDAIKKNIGKRKAAPAVVKLKSKKIMWDEESD